MATAHSSSSPPSLKTFFVCLFLLFCSVAVESTRPSLRKDRRIVVVKFNDRFLGKVYVGSKVFIIETHLSTRNNLALLLCYPCPDCYPHDDIFRPYLSGTYQKASCDDAIYCTTLPQHECDEDKKCKFAIGHPSDNHISGYISFDRLRFASYNTPVLWKFYFGCVHESTSPDNGKRPQGLLGLSRDPRSLVSQLKETIFSYCYPHARNTGWVDFGSDVDDPDPEAVTTAFVDVPNSFQYHIQINSLTVEYQETIVINQQHKTFLVNTGNQRTYVDPETMNWLTASLRAAIPYHASNSKYDLCFTIREKDNTSMPRMRIDFIEGGWIVVNWWNFLQRVDKNTMCSTILSFNHRSSEGQMPAIGNQLLISREIMHDLESNKMSFSKPDKC